MGRQDQTETQAPPKQRRQDPRRPALVVVLQGRNPSAVPMRIRLDPGCMLELGRGASFASTTHDAGVRVEIPDSLMSGTHARIKPLLGGHELEDSGSKNGTQVNWLRQPRAALHDGDWIEVGGTLLRYRTAGASADEPFIVEASDDELATFVPELDATYTRARQAASSSVPILITGETGTGKEVVARAIYRQARRSGPFVAVNCAAISSTLLEAELFGYRRGAFSGATEDRLGLIRSAEGGALMLDEIGELPAPAQAALLRVLQEREVLPVGGERAIPVDIRVIAATHRDLEAAVAAGTFREDLLARLKGLCVELMPLRERLDDLGILVRRLLVKLSAASTTIEPEAARALARHAWPRNVRELEMVLSTALVANPQRIELAALPEHLQGEPEPDAEVGRRKQLEALLVEHRGNVSHVAQAMGKARSLVQKWLVRYGIDAAQFRR